MFHPTAEVMGIEILRARLFHLAAAVRYVPKVSGHRVIAHFTGILLRGKHCIFDSSALIGLTDIDNRFRQRDQPLGVADILECGQGRGRNDKRLRVCHPHVLGGMNDEPAQNEHRVATALDEPHCVVKSGVCIAPAQRLAERGQKIVIQILIIGERLTLNGLLGIGKRHMDAPVCLWRCGQDGEFKCVICGPQIAARHLCNMIERTLLNRSGIGAEPLAFILQSLEKRSSDIIDRERLERKNAAARDNCGRHGRIRIFGRRSDKYDRPLFDGRKQGIGLRLIEAMALIEHEIGAAVVHFEIITRPIDRFFDVGNTCIDGVKFDKVGIGLCGNDVGERRFPASGRAPEDTASQPVERNRAPQKTSLCDDVFLPDKVVQCRCAHALCERFCFFLVVVKIKQVHYSPMS